ncbi:response regulator [Novosphingobium naphthalenivorans]|uniref:response regulator n=1 Tax=Novosphingobium naphthalenivorans TaxID=273168 RepID=UPI00055C2AE5|nr:response regulator [Novosphingobium naphthalenivorans]
MGATNGLGNRELGAALIVEDEPLVRAMAADIFMDQGYRIHEACNAAEALTILEGRDDIRAVFTDVEMPGEMNGLALATAIRERWPDIIVLVTSGRVWPGDGMMPIGTDFIAKPYRSRDIVSKIEALARPA